MFKLVVHPTRRQVLKAGALAAAVAGLRPAVPALAARPDSLFELDLSGLTEGRAAAASAGWRTTPVLRAPRRFDLVGLRWARGSRARAQVRARKRGGRWTEWATLHNTGDHAPDSGKVPAGTDPAFVGAADEFQLRLQGAPRDLRARFVRALPTARLFTRMARRLKRRRGASIAQAGAPPAIIPRSAWGGDSVPPREPPVYGAVHMAFVHHTVTTNDYGPEDSAGIVLAIARYHRDSNRWNDIGYQFLVDKYGQIFEGRAGGVDQAVVGAQAQGWNSLSTGISCLGDFTAIAQTPAGMDALARLIGWKLALHGVPTQGTVTLTSGGGETNRYPAGTPVTFETISGHRDGNNTSCPGNVLYTQLEELRTAAAQHAGPATGLTVLAPRQIRGVRSVEVSGTLRFADGSAPGGVSIDVEYQPEDAGIIDGWRLLATTMTAVDGTWRVPAEFPRSGHVRASFKGDGTRAPLVSAARDVAVIPRLNITLSRKRLRRGQQVKIAGHADPATRVRFTLERRNRGRWRRRRRRMVRVRNGRYSLRIRPGATGKYRITVQVGSVKRRRIIVVG